MSNDPILQGLRVVEASAFVAAPLGGMTLAQLGADVIRIDPLHGGLDRDRWPVTDDNVSLFWCGLNKHKRSVALDLGSPEGRELASAIVWPVIRSHAGSTWFTTSGLPNGPVMNGNPTREFTV
jgi:crotonobetainyl-CoA:carnitine CoA-transferase CaiB-like acyl-CoA transferase